MCNIQNQGNEYQCPNSIKKLIIIQIFIQRLTQISFIPSTMRKSKSNSMLEHNETSSLLLNHIKDQQFYSTLSTITLQLAKETGVQKSILDELYRCFSKVKGCSNQPMLTFEKQNNHSHQNINQTSSGSYDEFEKSISLKQQIHFLSKMENQLIQSREKQICIHSLNKYATTKQTELLPLLSIETPTKVGRFKSLLNRKKKGKVCTTQDYFKLNPLDLLKNAYQNSNECYVMMRNFTLLKTVFGHSMDEDPESNCPLYNVLFDQSENLIISGGQQGAIKIWSKQTGLLLSSLKGHQQYINKLEVTKCNKYICSSAGDGIRFFQLKDMTTLTGWKAQSIIQITSIYDESKGLSKFMFGDKKSLYILDELKMVAAKQRALTKDDFLIYKYSHKLSKQAFILNIQINSDQTYVLLGFEFGDIFLFHYKDLFTIEPIKAQTEPLSNIFNLPVRHHLRTHRDQIRELKWHQNNQNFVSGGKQGYCLLWEYKNEKMPTILKDIQVSKLFNRRKKRAFGCNFICFNCTYSHFVAGFMQLVDDDDEDRGNGDIIAYSLESKEVIFQFSKDMPMKVASIRGMDTHPVYPNIVVVCEGTGRILIIDFLLKTILNTFQLRGFHLLHPHFSLNPGDCRFSKDGKYFVVSTQFGSISVFGYDLKNFYDTCPSQQFFANDFTSFTVNEKMQPIPIQGDLQIDMNRVQRGQIRKILGHTYQKQFGNNFHKYWKQLQYQNQLNPIDHKNTLLNKDGDGEENHIYQKYLEKIKFNFIEAETFNNLYHKNIQQIQATKQSLLYQQRQKQSKVFKKIIEQKIKRLKGDSFSTLPAHIPTLQLTHDSILQQIDAKGKRGGCRLTKLNHQSHPNYRDEFEYNSANQEEYNIEQDGQQDLKQLDYNQDSDDQIPRTTRRQFPNNRRSQSRPHYNIRSRPNGRTRYREAQQSEEQKKQKKFKRRSPAQDVEQMLKDDTFRDYDMSKGRKRRKRNKMQQEDDDFLRDESYGSDLVSSAELHSKRRDHNDNSNSRRRGRPKRMVIPELEQPNSESQEDLYNGNKNKYNEQQQSQQKFSDELGHHYLRNRNHNSTKKNSSTKKAKHVDLGECYRCGVNPGKVSCHLCQMSLCESCNQKRGKQLNDGKYECFVCSYIYSTGTVIVDQSKLTEQYFRLNQRSHEVYVPQLDDQVRFFFQGYEQFISQNIKNLNIEPIRTVQDYLLMPHIYTQIYGEYLFETPLCRVKDIKYLFPFNSSGDYLSKTYRRRANTNQPKHINMLVNLQIVFEDENKKKEIKKTDFWVFYIPTPNTIDSFNQYLLREQVFKYIEDNKTLQSLKQNQTVEIYGEEYQIISVNPSQDCFPQSIWRQVKVSRSDGKRLRHMSKQAEKLCNVWEISSIVPTIQYQHNYKPQQYQKKLLDRVNYIRENIEDYNIYEDYVDFQIVSTYRNIIECGICLIAIEQRITNNYYRSIAGLQFDLDHMVQNSINFNGEDNDVTNTGIKIRKQLLEVANVSEEQLKKFNPKQEIKEIKKEKRIAKKKQLDDMFIGVDQVPSFSYGLRNQRSLKGRNIETAQKGEKKPVITTRNRKISQDSESSFKQVQKPSYEQEQIITLKRPSLRPQRTVQTLQKVQSHPRLKKHDKDYDRDFDKNYDKEEEVYRNIQNSQNNRRMKARQIDSSFESVDKNSVQAYPTRRSSRLHH